MIDAYHVSNLMLDMWRKNVVMSDAASLTKEYNDVPVYVNINNELKVVNNIEEIDGKIILSVE